MMAIGNWDDNDNGPYYFLSRKSGAISLLLEQRLQVMMASAGSLTCGKVRHGVKSQGSSEMNVLYIYIGTNITTISVLPVAIRVVSDLFSLALCMQPCSCGQWAMMSSEKISILGSSGNETSSHETALVTCFRALGNVNTRRYAYNQQQQS